MKLKESEINDRVEALKQVIANAAGREVSPAQLGAMIAGVDLVGHLMSCLSQIANKTGE